MSMDVETYLNRDYNKQDPRKWLADMEALFPAISTVARKYLSIASSCVPSERIFSLTGNIVSKKGACLKPENVDMLIFLKKK